ncbi:cytochrome P450 [Flagelloscypha sp. PMI_526]|nr:cytochrome P450 [Flagelloscypha sp. PMI_526]
MLSLDVTRTNAFLGLAVAYLLQRTVSIWVEEFPGWRTWFNHGGPFATVMEMFFPRLGIRGRRLQLLDKRKMYNEWGVTTSISALPSLEMRLFVAHAEAIKDITLNRSVFLKPAYKNIVASEGHDWKRYRKISSPAFSPRNNRLVWTPVHQLPAWSTSDGIVDINPLDFTLPFALRVIGTAGFGQSMPWTSDHVEAPEGHALSFVESIEIVSNTALVNAIVPNWIPNWLSKGLRRTRLGFSEMRKYMTEMIQERREAGQNLNKFDLFSGLLETVVDDDETLALDESEIMGNVFVFLIAGHETTAHTLAYTFGLLALYQEEQELARRDVEDVCRDGQLPRLLRNFENVPFGSLCLAISFVTTIPKVVPEDTTITVSNNLGVKRVIAVPRGTEMSIHTTGLHYNAKYWPDPEAFKPEKFLDPSWPRDAFLAFSAGARSCIGRTFAETEAIAIISLILLKYRVEIQPSFLERTKMMTPMERREALLHSNNLLTLTPVNIPLRFIRR